MNALVIFDSDDPEVADLACEIAAGIRAHATSARAMHVRDVTRSDVRDAGLVVVGAPSRAAGAAVASLAFVMASGRAAWQGRHVAAFEARDEEDPGPGVGAKLDRRLTARGAVAVAPPEVFARSARAEGERARARAWGEALAQRARLGSVTLSNGAP